MFLLLSSSIMIGFLQFLLWQNKCVLCTTALPLNVLEDESFIYLIKKMNCLFIFSVKYLIMMLKTCFKFLTYVFGKVECHGVFWPTSI